MENDLCQNHPPHNYNMLITYFIKEVYYGLADEIMQAKDTWRKSSDAWISLSLSFSLRSQLPHQPPHPTPPHTPVVIPSLLCSSLDLRSVTL